MGTDDMVLRKPGAGNEDSGWARGDGRPGTDDRSRSVAAAAGGGGGIADGCDKEAVRGNGGKLGVEGWVSTSQRWRGCLAADLSVTCPPEFEERGWATWAVVC